MLWTATQRCLAREGRLLTAGAHAGGLVTLDTRLLYHLHHRIIGATGGDAPTLEAALAAAAQGKYEVNIFDTLPLEHLRALVESRQAVRVIIQVRSESAQAQA